MKNLSIRNLIVLSSLFAFSLCFGQNTNTFSPKFKISKKTTHKIKKDQEYTFGYLEVLENRDKPNGNFNGKNALCINFEDNLPDIGVVMSEVLMRHNGYNVFNSGSHAELGELSEIIIKRKIDIVLFYLCNLQCCNAVVEDNVAKTVTQIFDSIKVAKKLDIKILFGGEGLFLLDDIKGKIDNSFLTYNDLKKLI